MLSRYSKSVCPHLKQFNRSFLTSNNIEKINNLLEFSTRTLSLSRHKSWAFEIYGPPSTKSNFKEFHPVFQELLDYIHVIELNEENTCIYIEGMYKVRPIVLKSLDKSIHLAYYIRSYRKGKSDRKDLLYLQIPGVDYFPSLFNSKSLTDISSSIVYHSIPPEVFTSLLDIVL